MLVGQRVHHGHGAGQGELELVDGVGARETHLVGVDRARPAHRAGDGRAVGLVAVGADADALHPGEVDALDAAEEAVHEMHARLLALGHDVDARRFLHLEGGAHCVALALRELLAGELPRRPQLLRPGKPRRLGQAAGDRGCYGGSGFAHAGIGARLAVRSRRRSQACSRPT
jgi:hypothetical protein